MPLPALADPEIKAAKEDVESDLRWLLSDNGVDEDIQIVLHHFGINSKR